MGAHAWYGPEHYREPKTHLSAAIQWPMFPDPERWANRVVNGFVRDEIEAMRGSRLAAVRGQK